MRVSRATVLLLLSAALALAAGYPRLKPTYPPDLHYRVRLLPGYGYEIELRAHGLTSERPGFRLLDGWGILQDQAGHVEEISATDGEGQPLRLEVEREDGETVWRPESIRGESLTLRYRVRGYDPFESPEASFVDRGRIVLLGCSVFLVPAEVSHFQDLPIEVQVEIPFGWPMWSSWPRHGSTFAPPTLHDLWSGVVVGGNFHPTRLRSGSVAVTVLSENSSAAHLVSGIGNRLLTALRAMHTLFGAAPRGEELDVLAVFRVLPPREPLSLMTGNSEEGAFLCLATPDRYRHPDALTALAVHECLHFYLGGAVAASPEPPYRNAPDVIWFMEGMTEYLTYRLMAQEGILGEGTLEDVIARKEREYAAASSARGLSLADAARRMSESEVYSIVYSRGFLVGLLLDETATRRCGPGTLDTALRRLFEGHSFYRGEHAVSPEVVRAVLEEACPDLGEIIDRYAEGNAELPPRSVLAQETP